MSSHVAPAAAGGRKAVTLRTLRDMHARGERIAMLTCYDSTFAQLLDEAGVDALLVGDSLGMVLQGRASTLPVKLEDIVYHTRCVAARNRAAWLVADLPFGSYQTLDQALGSASTLMRAGAQMVKLEGGGWTADFVHKLVERGIPVCAHLGLTPQSVHALGGWRVQGREAAAAELLLRHAAELHEAGASMMVLELIPSALAERLRAKLPELITIGIGAGPHTSGQVLVLHDMLGLCGKPPRFVKNYMQDGADVRAAVRNYVGEVREAKFPAPAHCDH